MSTPATPDPSSAGRPARTPAAARAEEFLARVLPGLDDDGTGDDGPDDDSRHGGARPIGVDAVTQARLEAMGAPDRESW